MIMAALVVQVPEGTTFMVGEPKRDTLGYWAPEVEIEGIHNGVSDLWSLGAVLLEALIGQLLGGRKQQCKF